MIVLRYNTLEITFDTENRQFSGDETFIRILDDSELRKMLSSVYAPFFQEKNKYTGLDGIVLSQAIELLGDEVEVIAYQPITPPLVIDRIVN